MLKMCQAIANLEITVECVLPGRVKKERLFSYYGIKTPFRVTSIALSGGVARRPLHRLLGDLYARRKRDDFDFALIKTLSLPALRLELLGFRQFTTLTTLRLTGWPRG